MATLLDTAREAGVAKPTVSRVLRKDSPLSASDEVGEKIFAAARALGYEMKQKKMLDRTTANIMVVHKNTHFMNQVDNAYCFSARTGIEEACHKRKYKFTFTPFQLTDSVEEKPDGALVVGNFEKVQVDLISRKIRTSDIVLIGKVNYYPDKMDWITYDIKDYVYKNMDYLRECGYRRIAYMGGYDNEDTPPDFSKSAYFEQYMKPHSEPEFVGSMMGEHSVESGCQMMNRWLAEDRELPDAFFISSDSIAIGAIKALDGHPIGVPDVVAVTTVNGDSLGTFSFPTLTIMDVHTYETRKEAVAVLEERIHHKRTLAKKVELQVELMGRESVKRTD